MYPAKLRNKKKAIYNCKIGDEGIVCLGFWYLSNMSKNTEWKTATPDEEKRPIYVFVRLEIYKKRSSLGKKEKSVQFFAWNILDFKYLDQNTCQNCNSTLNKYFTDKLSIWINRLSYDVI